MKKLFLFATCSAFVTSAFALTASDDASNYGGGWTDATNQGTGFGAWNLTDNNNDDATFFAGYFLGDSTAGVGDLNTGGNSFGVYANPSGSFATAKRSFVSSLSINDQFSFNFGVNFDNGNKGFTVRNDSDQEVLGFNVGFGASINTDFTNNASSAVYDYGGGDALLQAVMQVIDVNTLTYEISRVSSSGSQGVLFSGSITGFTGTINAFTFYNSGTDSGADANNLYFNSLSVTNVPEPSSYALLAGACALLFVMQGRRR